MNVLELNHLSIRYKNGKEAVRDVSLVVPEKAIVAIVGESGSGKSTIIRGVLHLLPAGGRITDGSIRFGDKNMRDYTDEEVRRMRGKDMAMIFQDAGDYLNPRRKIGGQFMETISAHQTMSKPQRRALATEMLTKMKLHDPEQIMNSYPFQLSGGMRQRVAIAMAMSMKPRLLMADEPTSALDATVQAQVVKEMIDLKNTYGTAIMIVTHNMGVASKMADYIAVMKDGRLMEFGERDQVIFKPASDYTKQLLAAVPRLEVDHRCN